MAIQQDTIARPGGRPWLPAAMAAATGAVVVGLLCLLWFGLQQKEIAGSKVVNVPFTNAPDFSIGLFDGSTFTQADCAAWASFRVISMASQAVYGEDLLAAGGIDWEPYSRHIGERASARRISADRKAAAASRAPARP